MDLTSPTTGVWGGSGYLGTRVCAALQDLGGSRALARDELPSGVQLLVDASYPSVAAAAEAERYLQRVAERSAWAAAHGSRYVHIASTSSLPPVTSDYGRLKARAEAAAVANGGHLLRAGLVTSDRDPGGRFLELLSIVRRLPVVPLPTTDQFRLYVSDLDAVVAAVAAYLRPGVRPVDRWVPGTVLSSLTQLLQPQLRPDQRVLHLGARPSRAAAAVARRLHIGPLDSLASIASPPPSQPTPEELDQC